MGLRNAITAALRAPFMDRGSLGTPDSEGVDYASSNGFTYKGRNAADTADIPMIGVDGNDALQLGAQCIQPTPHTFKFNLSTNASLANQQFWIAPYACTVTSIKEIHATAGSDSGAVTAYIEKLSGTTAVGSGTSLMSGTFNMKGTINTQQTATLSTARPNGADLVTSLATGDRIGIVFSGTLTALAGVMVEITVTPGFKVETATFAMNANGDLADQAFFVANRPCIVTGAYYVHAVKGTDASAVNVQLVKDTSTDAPGAGTDLLTNSSSAGFNCKGANYTVQTGTLTATAASLRLAPGDRLSVDFAGTLTALAGVVLVVTIQPLYTTREITFNLAKNGNLVDQCFWIADRGYRIIQVREVHSTAGTDGSAVNVQVTIDKTTDAPGAGTDMLTNNTNAGFNLKGTANTVQIGTLVDRGLTYLMQDDRLSVDFAGTLTSLAGVVVTVELEPA